MTSPPLVASKHTCYKLVTNLSTRARNVNALDHDVPHAQSTSACILPLSGVYLRLYLPYRECCPRSQNKNNTCTLVKNKTLADHVRTRLL